MIWIDNVISLYEFLLKSLTEATLSIEVELGNNAADPRSMRLNVIRGNASLKNDNAFDHNVGQIIILEGWVYDRDRLAAYKMLQLLQTLTLNLVIGWSNENKQFECMISDIQPDMDAFDPSYGFRSIINTTAISHDFSGACIDENRRTLQDAIRQASADSPDS